MFVCLFLSCFYQSHRKQTRSWGVNKVNIYGNTIMKPIAIHVNNVKTLSNSVAIFLSTILSDHLCLLSAIIKIKLFQLLSKFNIYLRPYNRDSPSKISTSEQPSHQLLIYFIQSRVSPGHFIMTSY